MPFLPLVPMMKQNGSWQVRTRRAVTAPKRELHRSFHAHSAGRHSLQERCSRIPHHARAEFDKWNQSACAQIVDAPRTYRDEPGGPGFRKEFRLLRGVIRF